jgi:hypothetical protein
MKTYFFQFFVTIATALLLSWLLITNHLNALSESIPPPVVVVNYPEMNKKYFDGTLEPGAFEKAYDEINEKIDEYKSRGFVVLDGRSVLTAPDALYISAQPIEKEKE